MSTPTQDTQAPPARPTLLTRFSVPKGNYDNWTPDQAFEAEYVCKIFANSYVIDFNATAAAIRLGSLVESAGQNGAVIFNHWLTQHYIQEFLSRFESAGLATRDRVFGLLWRDASHFGQGSNAIARVAAQKCLAAAMGMSEAQVNRRSDDALKDVARGGVIMVKMYGSAEEWERSAEVAQSQMLKELEDDE